MFFACCMPYLSFCCEPLHIFDDSVIIDDDEPNDDYLYCLDDYEYAQFNIQTNQANYAQPHPPEYYLNKAIKAYDLFKYDKCIQYIKEYERETSRPPRLPSNEEKVLALSYKAYCKKYQKKYESATDYFEELIQLMKKGGYAPECLFSVYLQHASCYAGMGKKEKCKEKIKKLIDLNIGPTLADLQARNYMVNSQPCFHMHELRGEDRMIINEIIAAALGENIASLQQQGQLIPTFANCCYTNEKIEFCQTICRRLFGYAGVAVVFIPNKLAQAAALIALVEFEMECTGCCESGLGSENCCKNLKWAIQTAMNMNPLEGI